MLGFVDYLNLKFSIKMLFLNPKLVKIKVSDTLKSSYLLETIKQHNVSTIGYI